MTSSAVHAGTRSVGESADAIADALGWPRSRPARMLVGSRATMIDTVAICTDEAAIDSVEKPASTLCLLVQPPSPAFARSGRRAYDVFVGESNVAEWMRSARPIMDASEMICGGRDGLEHWLATAAGAQASRPLVPVDRDEVKFVGFVPVDALDVVRHAVFAAGAGRIGNYSECSWSTMGTGTFRGSDASSPTVGTAGEFEQVDEVRFETVVPGNAVARVSRAFIDAHPYEEPAFDVYALRTPAHVGRGRIAAVQSRSAEVVSSLESHGLATCGARTETVRDGIVVTAGPLTAILPSLLDLGTSAVVVCAQASDVEIALLGERNFDVITIDALTVARAAGTSLQQRLADTLDLDVVVAEALAFPDDPDASAAEVGVEVEQVGRWRLNFDGGSRGNPGPAAYGFVLQKPDGSDAAAVGDVLGSTTNNVAEYTGLIRGLERAREFGVREINVLGDSELIVKQVRGEYRVKNEQLKPLHQQVIELIKQFDAFSIEHVYRSDNAAADALVNEALDAL